MNTRAYGEISIPRRALHALHHFGAKKADNVVELAARRAAFGAWMTLNVAAHANSKGHRLGAATRLWLWQIWRRTAATPVVVDFPCGAQLRCPPWSKMAGVWVSIGYHEEELVFLLDVIEPGEVFVDVGANLGVYSMVAASRGATIIAFEPVPTARQALEDNARLNRVADRVTVHACALSDENGQLKITTDLESSNHLVQGDGPGTVVDVRKLDDVLREFASLADTPRIAVIKVDAEGFDANVLRGSQETLEAHRPAVIVEVWAGGRDVRAALEPHGYRMFHFDASAARLEAVPDDFSREGYFVALHESRIDEFNARLRRAPRGHRGPRVHWRG